MATITACILVGQCHTYHGGIDPSHGLFLSENSTPGWILTDLSLSSKSTPSRRLVWIPTLDSMLEDGLLMVAVHALESNADRLLLHDVEATLLENLRKELRQLTFGIKLVVTVLAGSSIVRQLPVLSNYNVEVEICPSTEIALTS